MGLGSRHNNPQESIPVGANQLRVLYGREQADRAESIYQGAAQVHQDNQGVGERSL